MASHEPGRPYPDAPDPTDTHYIVSELAEYQLRALAEAMRAAAMLCDELGEHVSDFGPREAGALFHVFAERTVDLLATARCHYPATERGA